MSHKAPAKRSRVAASLRSNQPSHKPVSLTLPTLDGAGVGLRTPHIGELLQDADSDAPRFLIPWLELLADNWLPLLSDDSSFGELGGLNLMLLDAVSERFPLTLHGVGLSLGSVGELDFNYLQQIKQLKQRTNALHYSEHCSFSWLDQQARYVPDLLPLPYTEEAIKLMVEHIQQAQDFLGEQILLENVSSYISYEHSQISEAEFISAIVEAADCFLLLDINNIYVTCQNQNISPPDYLKPLPHHRVKEIHLAGHEVRILSTESEQQTSGLVEQVLLDTHSRPVCGDVWSLYSDYLLSLASRDIKSTNIPPTLIEWDNDLPSLMVLNQEREKAQQLMDIMPDQTRTAITERVVNYV